MENFIVSARKYRPMTFDTVVGQQHITATLKNAIRNRQLAQAFLFTGPRGVGKTTCARILAKTINCMNLGENIEPCNECESCVSFNRSASFNIHELDAASNNSVEDIRNLVDQVRIPPQVGRYKVYIIDEVHMLSQSAFNAFLKTLEEPPEYAKFILATTEKHKIIPTILSRCQIYDFKRILVKDIAAHLAHVADKEGITADGEALQIIAQKADGALRDALSMFDQLVSFAGKELKYEVVTEHLNVLDYDYYFKITDFLLEAKVYEALLTLNDIVESGFDGQHFISGMGAHFRDLLMCQDERTIDLLEVGERVKERYLDQTRRSSPAFLLRALDLIQKAEFNYKNSNNKRLLLEIAIMQLCSLTQAPETTSVAQPAAPAKKKPDIEPTPLKAEPKPPVAQVTKPVEAQREIKKPDPPAEKKTAEKPAASRPSTGFIPGTISIKDDVEEEDQETEEDEVFDFESDEFMNAPPLNEDELMEAWKKYAASISTEHPDLFSTLNAGQPQIGEDFELILEVKNLVQQRKLEEQKNNLIAFIRTEMGNRFIRLRTVVNADAVQLKPYGAEEVFNHLAGKNPAVKSLKQKFGLDIQM
ncbi:MAG: DNA polymerase III subunit gamma/tau [Bacteroidales bacterium]